MAKSKNKKVERVDDDEEDLIGHNNGPEIDEDDDESSDVGGVAGARVKSILDRVERLEEDKKAIAEDIKEVWSEAKGAGFDVPTMKKLLKIRQQDTQKRREQEELLELYKAAIGME